LYRKGLKKRGKFYFMISIKIKGRELKIISVFYRKKRGFILKPQNIKR